MAAADASAHAIEATVLERLRPEPALLDRLAEVRALLVERGTALAKARDFPLVRCLVAGSAARGTFLRDRLDLDFFLLFPPTVSRADLERMGLELGAALLTAPETRYAEHPYRRGTFEGFTVDAVPGYAIEDPSHPLTAVDRTPFHQAYLAERETPALVDQIRLAKQFLRALGVYGSEARRGGCSGYLVELLVLRFGSLRALLAEARSWRIPVRLPTRPTAAPRVPDDVALVLDDPVDPNRNVATALTRRNLGLFILAAAEYLDRPRASAFELRTDPGIPRARGVALVESRGTHVTGVRLPRPALVDDILYPQLRKAERSIAEEIARLGFRVVGSAAAAGDGELVILVEVESAHRPVVDPRDGPPPGIDRVGDFLAKWTAADAPVLQGPFVAADGRLAVEARRAERRLEPLLTAALPRLPLGRDLTPGEGAVPLGSLNDSAPLREALRELLGKHLPWLPDAATG